MAVTPTGIECHPKLSIATNGSTKAMEAHLWKKALLYTRAFPCTHTCRDGRQVSSTACAFFQHSPTLSQQHAPHLSGIYFCLLTFTILNKMGLSLQIFLEHGFLHKALAELAFATSSTNMVPNRSSFSFAICVPKHLWVECLRYSYALINSGWGYGIMYSTTQHSVHGSQPLALPPLVHHALNQM